MSAFAVASLALDANFVVRTSIHGDAPTRDLHRTRLFRTDARLSWTVSLRGRFEDEMADRLTIDALVAAADIKAAELNKERAI